MATYSTKVALSSGGIPPAKNTASTDNPEAQLKTALDSFETSLLRPIVSGDLPGWVDDLERAWSEAAAQVHLHVQQLHPRQYEEISKQDPELLSRIDQLKVEDQVIDEQRVKLGQSLDRLVQHLPKLEPDEEKAQKHAKTFVDDAIAFIARVRKQSVSVQTWFIEAFNRDVGAVD